MSDEHKYRWPNGNERLFPKSIGRDLNVSTGRSHGLFGYAIGYRRSAEMLFEAIQTNFYYDTQYFALAFLWRQTLELTLKETHERLHHLEQIERVLESSTAAEPLKPLWSHKLQAMWDTLEPRLQKLAPGDPIFAQIGRVIQEFDQMDPNSDEFRYPTTRAKKSSKPSLQSIPPHVNFRDLHEGMSAIMNGMEAIGSDIQHRSDVLSDAISEFQADGETETFWSDES